MKALLLKDFYIMSKKLWFFGILIPIMSFSGNEAMTLLGFFYCVVLTQTTVYYDEQSRWNELAMVLPYKKSELHLNKFFLSYICLVGGGVLVFLGQLIGGVVMARELTFSVNFATFLAGVTFGLFYIGVNTPIVLIFGYAKSRLASIAIGVIAAVSFYFMMSFDMLSYSLIANSSSVDIDVSATPSTMPLSSNIILLLFAGAIVLNIVSMFVTLSVKSRK